MDTIRKQDRGTASGVTIKDFNKHFTWENH